MNGRKKKKYTDSKGWVRWLGEEGRWREGDFSSMIDEMLVLVLVVVMAVGMGKVND